MRNALLIAAFLFATCFFANAQEKEKSPTVEFLNKRGYSFDRSKIATLKGGVKKWPDTLYYNTVYRSKLLGSPTIPISFSKIESVKGRYVVSPTLSIGYGYEWFFGDFIFNETDKIMVEPTFFFGVIADVGIQNDFNLTKPASFFTGIFIGFASFNIFAGYDYLSHSSSIGLGGRFDVYTFHQNSLKPFGKVEEKRRHKTGTIPIRNE
jgi:hypothetical protein